MGLSNVNDLANALSEALQAISTEHRSEMNDMHLAILFDQVQSNPEQADPRISSLLAELKGDSALDLFDDKMVVAGNVARRVDFSVLGQWLLKQSARIGPERAVANLDRYLDTAAIPYLQTMAVYGIEPEERCEFGNGISLLNWQDLPDSGVKRALSEEAHITMPMPGSAFVREYPLTKCHVTKPPTYELTRFPDFIEIHDAMLCVGLIGPCAPSEAASWLAPPEWAPTFAGGYSVPHQEGTRLRTWRISKSQCLEAATIFEAFCQLEKERKDPLRLAMERLNCAMRRPGLVDAAIDLGIALETVFLNDLESDRGELSFRLRLRASRFLGEDAIRRKRLFTVFGDLYEARSQAVHTGRVPPHIHKRPIGELLEEGYRLTATALRRLIQGAAPEWTSIVLA